MFGRNFYCCKIISSETVWMKYSFGRKFFWSKIQYCCKIISSETVQIRKFLFKNFFYRNFSLLLQNHFLGNSLDEKSFGRKFFMSKNFWTKFLLLQNHFLGNRFDQKICGRKFFWSKKIFGRNFYCCKIISSETVWMRKFKVEIFFYCCKVISSGTVWMRKFLVEKLLCRILFGRNFVLLQNHFLGNSLDLKIFVKIFFIEIFFIAGKLFPRKQFG